jgi:hypothetical protein
MSDDYSIIFLNDELLAKEELHSWLEQQDVNIPVSSHPSRLPTSREICDVLDHLEICKTWSYTGGVWSQFVAVGEDREQWMDTVSPQPADLDDQLTGLQLTGYWKELIEPLLNHLATICGPSVVVKHNTGKIIYTAF